MSQTGDRENFFVLLELDPDLPWDEREFLRTLSTKQKQWTKDAAGIQTLPKTAAAKRWMSLVKDIKRVMLDAAARDEEATRARREQVAARAARRREFEARLELLARRGHLLESEVAALRQDFGDVLSANATMAQRLAAVPVRGGAQGGGEPRLDRGKEGQLLDYLATARLPSIYDALKLADPAVTEQSPRAVLLAAADALYLKEHRRMNKQDPAIKARERLAGLAKEFFRDDAQRARLDASLRLSRLHGLVEWLLAVLGAARAVSGGQVELYLEKARIQGVGDLDLALGYLRERLDEQGGWAVEMPAAEAGDRLRRLVTCPRCAGLSEPTSDTCGICAFPLREPCPSCGKVEPRYGGGCRCGFPIGQRELVEDLVVQAAEALDAASPAQADTFLRRAERIWKLPADSPDAVAVRLREARARLTAATQEIDRTRAAVEAMMRARRFVAASAALRTAPDALPGRRAMLDRAESIVRDARELCAMGVRAGSQARRVELFTEALKLCDDLAEARTELARMPPAAPGSVRAVVADPAEGVLVTWDRSPGHDISYVVVRRTGTGLPESADDLPGQTRAGEPAEPPFRDRAAIAFAGMPLTYAVFAQRFGTLSRPGVAPVVVAALDVELRHQAGEGQVVLTWELPQHAARIALTRQELDGPGGPGEPVPLLVTEPSRLVDTGVRNGVRYRYEARVAYPAADGELHWSAGRSIQVAPARRPEPPGPLVLTRSSARYGLYAHKVDIRLPEPERGELLVVRQDGPGTLREGDQGPSGTLKLDGYILHGRPLPPDLFLDEAPELLSYVPVLRVDGMDYAGRPRRYATRDEVKDLRGEFAGPAVWLGWSWPDGADRALVGHRIATRWGDEPPHPTGRHASLWGDDPPRPPGRHEGELLDPTTADRPLTVNRAPGERAGGCLIAIPPEETVVNVVVALVVERDGLDFVSAGTRRRLVRPQARVEYEVRRLGVRRASLLLRSAAPLDVPALVLRAHPDRPPRSREDGDLVTHVNPLHLRGQHSVSLPRDAAADVRYRLFTAEPEAATTVEIAPA